MKVVGFDGGRIGVTDAAQVWDITELSVAPPDLWPPVAAIDVVARFAELRPQIEQLITREPSAALADVALDAPVAWPSKIIAYPANYQAHVVEMITGNRADINGFFLKASSSLTGAGSAVIVPDIPGAMIHHECELAIVIGRTGRNIPLADARDYIFGYSCLIDVTIRGKQERVMRKSFDTFCPLGPWVVTADEVDDPAQLEITLAVNGDLRQRANTRDLIVGIDEMISLASSVCTLFPGDLIATGTPGGVGPIRPGDKMTIQIQHVGHMTIPVKAGGSIENRALPTTTHQSSGTL